MDQFSKMPVADRLFQLVCKLGDAKTLKPKYFIEPKYKVLLFLMRFMSNSHLEKMMESLYK